MLQLLLEELLIFIIPDVGTSRLSSAANGFINNTPVGPIRWMGAKGKEVSVRMGEPIILSLNKSAMERILNQRVAYQPKY